MAAAEGCVDTGFVSGVGRPSFRMGDVFRDVCGLAPAEGDAEGIKVLEGIFRSGGTGVVDAAEAWRGWLELLG